MQEQQAITGAYNWVQLMKHVWDCPNEWIQLDEAGHLNLPEHYAGDPDPDTPAYFINARPLDPM